MLNNPTCRVVAARTYIPEDVESFSHNLEAGTPHNVRREAEAFPVLPVSKCLAPPEMAVIAAQQCLDEAEWEPMSIDFVVYASTYFQGQQIGWSPAHYVAHKIGALEAIPLNIQQGCNGGAAALEVAIMRLNIDPNASRALLVTSDRFATPFDRWRTLPGLAMGDGAVAVLLEQDRGRNEIIAIASEAVSEMEETGRRDQPFVSTPADILQALAGLGERSPIPPGDLRRYNKLQVSAVTSVISKALTQAGLTGHDPRISFVCLPRHSAYHLENPYLKSVRQTTSSQVLPLGSNTGHLGAGDVLANLADVIRMEIEHDQVAIFVSGGAGFTYSCLILRA